MPVGAAPALGTGLDINLDFCGMGFLSTAEDVVGAHDWFGDEECERAHLESERSDGDERPDLIRDRDRVIHTTGLRVPQGKTQIFASHWADPMRTRLTHTLEVTQIGRGIARRIGLPEELVEACCLAHDVGHPPFGHVGERALGRLMKNSGGFDANAQNLRLLTNIERIRPDHPGLNLTRATLQSLVKYPYLCEVPAEREFLYDETLGEFLPDYQTTFGKWLFAGIDELPLSSAREPSGLPPRTLPCKVMDWADDAAYSVHDIEDAVHAGFVSMEAIASDSFVEAVTEDIQTRLQGKRFGHEIASVNTDSVGAALVKLKADLQQEESTSKMLALRRVTRRYLNDFIVDLTVERPQPAAGPYGFELVVPPQHRFRAEVLKSVVIESVLKDERVTRYLFKGRRMLQRVFEEIVEDPGIIDDSHHQLLPRSIRETLRRANESNALPRTACDYLAGMTENQLTLLYQTLYESTGGSPLR